MPGFRILPVSRSHPRVRLLASCAVFLLALAAGPAVASPEIDRLADLASKGDRKALDSLVDIARRKKDADAEYALAVMAYRGRGLEKNHGQAFRLAERAAQKGHADANNLLGHFYEHGIGTVADAARAFAAYEKGANAGSAQAQSNLGWMHEHGIGVTPDAAAAAQWYTKAAEQGLPAAQANLAGLYSSGRGISRNLQAAIALYELAAAGGVVSASKALGQLLEELGRIDEATLRYVAAANAKVPDADLAAGRLLVAADNPRRDVEAGVRFLEQAAARDKLDAALLLASLYDKGTGVKADAARAAGYFQRAAVLGDAQSAFRYAQYLAAHRSGPDSDPLPWLRRAAASGHAGAQYELARRLDERGAGAEARKEAIEWYRKSAMQGNVPAALGLAIALETGRGGTAAPSEAIEWYLKAAAANDAEAFFRLGNLYDRGIGTTADFGRARDYYSRAAALGHEEASRILQKMAGVQPEGLRNDPFKGMR